MWFLLLGFLGVASATSGTCFDNDEALRWYSHATGEHYTSCAEIHANEQCQSEVESILCKATCTGCTGVIPPTQTDYAECESILSEDCVAYTDLSTYRKAQVLCPGKCNVGDQSWMVCSDKSDEDMRTIGQQWGFGDLSCTSINCMLWGSSCPDKCGWCTTVVGCMHGSATNYNPDATVDDGSCSIPGCMDINSPRYNPNATVYDDSCWAGTGCSTPGQPDYLAAAPSGEACGPEVSTTGYPCMFNFDLEEYAALIGFTPENILQAIKVHQLLDGCHIGSLRISGVPSGTIIETGTFDIDNPAELDQGVHMQDVNLGTVLDLSSAEGIVIEKDAFVIVAGYLEFTEIHMPCDFDISNAEWKARPGAFVIYPDGCDISQLTAFPTLYSQSEWKKRVSYDPVVRADLDAAYAAGAASVKASDFNKTQLTQAYRLSECE